MNAYKYIRWGLTFALAGEIFDNFVVNHRPYQLLIVIIPLYAFFFFLCLKFYLRFGSSALSFSFIMGVIGLIAIENFILRKFSEPWPIQIFMFSYWFSIVSYPFIVINKIYRPVSRAILWGLLVGLLGYWVQQSTFMALAIFQFTFWVVSAIQNMYYLRRLQPVKIDK